MGFSVIGIAALVGGLLVVGIFVVQIITRLFRRGGGSSSTPVARGVTLNCPHCGETTEASRPQCQHCSKEL
ncbi:MAG: hypothetical protein ACKVHE_19775 [Planctomycetales bacterium]|jgi:hypothetical protein